MRKTFIVILIFFAKTIFAQSNGNRISGYILDTAGKPVDFATLTLLNPIDSAIISQSSSDKAGFFEIHNVPIAKSLLKITHVVFNEKLIVIEANEIDSNSKLADIIMEPSGKELSQVTVKSGKPVFVRQSDRLIVNVETRIVNASQADLIALISRLPGVYINRQQDIMVNGQQRALVAVNEKSTMLTKGDLMQYLKSIPVNTVKQIEIIYSPGAKYDAEGSVVINIQTDRKILSGLSGNFSGLTGSSIGYGDYYPKLNGGTSLSLGLKRFSIAGSYNYAHNNTLGEIAEKLSFPGASLEQAIRFRSLPERIHTMALTTVFQIDKKQDISLGYKKTLNHSSVDQQNVILLKTHQLLDSAISSNSLENVRLNQDALNFSYKNLIDSVSQLSISAAYIDLRKNYHAGFENAFQKYNTNSTENLASVSLTSIRGLIAQIDYYHMVGKAGKIEGGFKIGETRTVNNTQLSRIAGSVIQPDTTMTNYFFYKEKLMTAYAGYNTSYRRFNFSAGLRYQNRKINKGFADIIGNRFTGSVGFFPSLSFGYKPNEKLSFAVGYSRRIENPNYIDVNPYIYYVNPFTTLEGNPLLTPSITNKVDFTTSINDTYAFSLVWYKIDDFFTTAQFQDIYSRKQRLVPANVGNLSNLEFNFSAPFALASWWQVYVNTGVYYQRYKETGAIALGYITRSLLTFQLFTEHSFTLPRGYALELGNTLMSPTVQGQFGLNTINSFSGGVKKSFYQDKLALKIAFNDFLGTLRYNGDVKGAGWQSNYTNRIDSRQILVSFKYSFRTSTAKKAESGQIMDDELKRLPKK
jgi:iron complex outermembrane recepter protein